MRFLLAIAAVAVCLMSQTATAQTTSYSGTMTIAGKSVPLMMRGGGAKADGTGTYGFFGRGNSIPTFPGDPGVSVIGNLYEHNSTATLTAMVTTPGAIGSVWTARYESSPPLVGGLTMSLVGGVGVWNPGMPATVNLTSGP